MLQGQCPSGHSRAAHSGCLVSFEVVQDNVVTERSQHFIFIYFKLFPPPSAGPPRPARPEGHGGVLDVRGRPHFSRFDPRPGRPHFSNFGPPAEQRPFCKTCLRSRGKGLVWPLWSATRGGGGWATLAGLTGAHLHSCALSISRFDPKVPHFIVARRGVVRA